MPKKDVIEVEAKTVEPDLDEIKQMNIYQRIHAVTAEVGKVAMNLKVDTGNGRSYKAAGINDVVDSILPMLDKYRLVVINGEKEIIEDDVITTTTKYGEKNSFFVRLKAEVRAINIDKPEESVVAYGYGDGIDTGDKACGKADTYARKCALISLFNLSRGDDPDEEPSKEYQKKKEEPKKPEMTAEDFALEYAKVRQDLSQAGVDVHSEEFEKFVKEKAHVTSIEPGALLMNMAEGAKVLEVCKAVLKAKK